jgi:hypothetical protein
MKYKKIYLSALCFFLAKHTQLYYENYLGEWEGYLSFFFLLAFFALIIILCYHSLILVFKDLFQNLDVIPLFSNYFCEFQQLILHLKLRQSSYQDVGT